MDSILKFEVFEFVVGLMKEILKFLIIYVVYVDLFVWFGLVVFECLVDLLLVVVVC